MKDKHQYCVADKRGEVCEGAYETSIEAVVEIERMRLSAIKRKNDAEVRAKNGCPWCTDDDALKAVDSFAEREYRVVAKPLDDSVYRLNADISNDADFLREVLWKLRVFGEAVICWTCTGHTRAECQGAATAAFLSQHGYDCLVNSFGDVTVRTAKGVAV